MPIGLGWLDVLPGIASKTLTGADRAENVRGAYELAHLKQVAASSVLFPADVLGKGTTASEGARVLRKAGTKLVSIRTVAREWKNQAIDGEAEPEEEFLVQAE